MSRRSTPTLSCRTDPRHVLVRALACVAVALGAGGCGGIVRDYPGVSREALWAAALGVAERPTSYDDWHVVENGVYADEPSGRIELYRELKRDWQPLGQVRRRESETWSLTIQVEPDKEIQALRITQNATIRHRRFPLEADRFFDEVGLRLTQAMAAQGATGSPGAAPPPAPRGIQDAGADSLAVPEARDAVRAGGAPAQGLAPERPAPVPTAGAQQAPAPPAGAQPPSPPLVEPGAP